MKVAKFSFTLTKQIHGKIYAPEGATRDVIEQAIWEYTHSDEGSGWILDSLDDEPWDIDAMSFGSVDLTEKDTETTETMLPSGTSYRSWKTSSKLGGYNVLTLSDDQDTLTNPILSSWWKADRSSATKEKT